MKSITTEGVDSLGSDAVQDSRLGGAVSWANGAAVRRAAAALGIIGAAALVWRLIAVLISGWASPSSFDDAYMFCRYADHLLAGQGMTWNVGDSSTYGCTSLLFMFWVTLVRAAVSLEFWQVTFLSSWIAGIGAVVAMAWACRRVANGHLLKNWIVAFGFVAIAVVFRNGYFFHVSTGMDTTTAILANAIAVATAMRFRKAASLPAILFAAASSYVAFLARPDSLIYVVLFPLLLIAFRDCDRHQRGADVLKFVGALAVFILADTAIKWSIFGNPLPIPFYAKQRGFYEGYIGAELWSPVSFTRTFITNHFVAIFVVVLGFTHRAWRVTLAAMIPIALTFCYLATVMQIMGFAARFYYPALPLLLVAAYHILDTWLASSENPLRMITGRFVMQRGVALAGALLLLFPISARAERGYKQRARREHPNLSVSGLYDPPRSAPLRDEAFGVVRVMADFVNDCPSDAVWAMSEYGFISAAAPDVRILDLAGLHDPATIDGTDVVTRLFERQPDVLWFPTRNYTGMITAIQTHDVFINQYDYWPGAFEWGIAIKRDSAKRTSIMEAMGRAWRTFYDQPMPNPAQFVGESNIKSKSS